MSPWPPESQSTTLVSCHLGSQCLQPIIQWLACINCQAWSATKMPSLAFLWFVLAPLSTGSQSFGSATWQSILGLGLCSQSYVCAPDLCALVPASRDIAGLLGRAALVTSSPFSPLSQPSTQICRDSSMARDLSSQNFSFLMSRGAHSWCLCTSVRQLWDHPVAKWYVVLCSLALSFSLPFGTSLSLELMVLLHCLWCFPQ